MLTIKQLYGYSLMKWDKVKETMRVNFKQGKEEALYQCAFCFDIRNLFHTFDCTRCRINPFLCGGQATGGIVGLMNSTDPWDKEEWRHLVDRMIYHLKKEYYKKPFKYPGEDTDYYLGKL